MGQWKWNKISILFYARPKWFSNSHTILLIFNANRNMKCVTVLIATNSQLVTNSIEQKNYQKYS